MLIADMTKNIHTRYITQLRNFTGAFAKYVLATSDKCEMCFYYGFYWVFLITVVLALSLYIPIQQRFP